MLHLNNKKIIKKLSNEKHVDNPDLRQKETTRDKAANGKEISKLRLTALKQAREMPVSEDETTSSPTDGYIFSQPPVPERSNWIQMGPTAIPHGQTRSELPVLVSGRITAVVLDPTDPDNILYVGTAQGGIWKTIDGGRNWVAKSDYAPSLSIGALVMDPKNPSILYAGTGEGNIVREHIGHHPESYYGCGILKTSDGGEKWILLGEDGENNPFIGASFFRMAINPINPSIIFAATTFGLYRSTDRGEHWSLMKIDLQENMQSVIAATDVVINPLDPNIIYAAFWSKGIYKTAKANADNPSWIKLEGEQEKKFPTDGFNRIALSISYSSPDTVYALMSNPQIIKENKDIVTDAIDKFYCTIDGGSSWKKIDLPGKRYREDYGSKIIGPQGKYNLNVAVDPTTPDIVYLSGVSVWKAIRNTSTDRWDIRDIGQYVHSDNHAFTFSPNSPFTIYTGTDGGIYKSTNGGETWIDVINEGLCITQFEFMDQHPTSDAVIFGGTQDNGTLQYRNNPAFYFSAYGDGGFVSVDYDNPTNVIHQFVWNKLYHSKEAGKYNSWIDIPILNEENKDPISLFYAPFTLDQENPKNIAFGSNKIFLDTDQGFNQWKIEGHENSIELHLDPQTAEKPAELVSAINFVNPTLIYAATIYGKVYRITKTQAGWDDVRIDDADRLPPLYIWDVVNMPDDPNTIIVIMAGFGSEKEPSSHIWRCSISEKDGKVKWEDISGEAKGQLPDTPLNSITIDPKPPHTIYVGSDIGVFRTSKASDKTWIRFSHGLPNCAVYDMRVHTSTPRRLLRIVTHGRGMWERDLDAESISDVNLFVRDHLMDTGRFTPSSDAIKAAFAEDHFQKELGDNANSITLGNLLSWDMSADIKVDSLRGDPPSYQMDIEIVDYVKFEYELYNHDPEAGRVSRVYVQIHNRGIKAAKKQVRIKLLYANAIANDRIKYPNLPKNFWTDFPSGPKDDTFNWKSVGEYKILPDGPKTLTNTEPTIVAWQWNVPLSEADRVGLLVIIDSPEDPIPESNKVLDIERLVRNEKHVGLRTMHLIRSE